MLIIRTPQVAALDGQLQRGFEIRLRQALEEHYIHVLPRLPLSAREVVVTNMLARAKSWGITWESAMVRFAEIMLAVAPSFDEQARIRAVLSAAGPDINLTVLTLEKRVADDAWAQAEAESHDLPLFLSPVELTLSPRQRNARAIGLALGDLDGHVDADDIAVIAQNRANAAGWMKIADAVLTLGVGLRLYGNEMTSAQLHPWVTDVFDGTRDARTAVAMLKYRIALDHGRFV